MRRSVSDVFVMIRIFGRNVRNRWRELVDRRAERWRGQRFNRERFDRIHWK